MATKIKKLRTIKDYSGEYKLAPKLTAVILTVKYNNMTVKTQSGHIYCIDKKQNIKAQNITGEQIKYIVGIRPSDYERIRKKMQATSTCHIDQANLEALVEQKAIQLEKGTHMAVILKQSDHYFRKGFITDKISDINDSVY